MFSFSHRWEAIYLADVVLFVLWLEARHPRCHTDIRHRGVDYRHFADHPKAAAALSEELRPAFYVTYPVKFRRISAVCVACPRPAVRSLSGEAAMVLIEGGLRGSLGLDLDGQSGLTDPSP
jgi:hypothetical protein